MYTGRSKFDPCVCTDRRWDEEEYPSGRGFGIRRRSSSPPATMRRNYGKKVTVEQAVAPETFTRERKEITRESGRSLRPAHPAHSVRSEELEEMYPTTAEERRQQQEIRDLSTEEKNRRRALRKKNPMPTHYHPVFETRAERLKANQFIGRVAAGHKFGSGRRKREYD